MVVELKKRHLVTRSRHFKTNKVVRFKKISFAINRPKSITVQQCSLSHAGSVHTVPKRHLAYKLTN